MFAQYNDSQCEIWVGDVRFFLSNAILIEVLGGGRLEQREANIRLCERERARIESACRKAKARAPNQSVITLIKSDFVGGPARVTDVRLTLTFPDNKTAQQFAGWVYSEGYPERVVSQNTVTVKVLHGDSGRIVKEATGRKGQVVNSDC